MSETTYQVRLMLALSRVPGIRVHRQNVGNVRIHGTERRFRAGPPPGAADISGIVGPEGWRLEVECKVRGRLRRREQIAWAEMMDGLGAVYFLADEKRHTVEQAVREVVGLIEARRALGGQR